MFSLDLGGPATAQNEAFGSFLDSIKSGLAAVVPSNTIVGKWANGNTSGAIQSATSWGSSLISHSSKPPTTAPVLPNQPSSGFSLGSPTGLLLVGGLGVAALLLLKKRR